MMGSAKAKLIGLCRKVQTKATLAQAPKLCDQLMLMRVFRAFLVEPYLAVGTS
jgi:hypothetical protein